MILQKIQLKVHTLLVGTISLNISLLVLQILKVFCSTFPVLVFFVNISPAHRTIKITSRTIRISGTVIPISNLSHEE
jgi:hypothetical protein